MHHSHPKPSNQKSNFSFISFTDASYIEKHTLQCQISGEVRIVGRGLTKVLSINKQGGGGVVIKGGFTNIY